jgi:hypothetical protein
MGAVLVRALVLGVVQAAGAPLLAGPLPRPSRPGAGLGLVRSVYVRVAVRHSA